MEKKSVRNVAKNRINYLFFWYLAASVRTCQRANNNGRLMWPIRIVNSKRKSKQIVILQKK